MPRSVILPVTALIALALFNPAVLAEDGVKIDPRVKGVEEQLERESKPVDIDAKRAKEAFVAAYQKECKARVKVFESAIAACEKKIKSAKSASDTKSEAALTAKLEELKVELETWKGNEGKKWEVKMEEGEEDEKDVKNSTTSTHASLLKKMAGKWKERGNDVTIRPNGTGTHGYEAGLTFTTSFDDKEKTMKFIFSRGGWFHTITSIEKNKLIGKTQDGGTIEYLRAN